MDDQKILDEIKDWKLYLSEIDEEKDLRSLEKHQQTGRPLGNKLFITDLEAKTGRSLTKRKPGPIKVTVGVPLI